MLSSLRLLTMLVKTSFRGCERGSHLVAYLAQYSTCNSVPRQTVLHIYIGLSLTASLSSQPACDVGWHSSAVAWLLSLLHSQRPTCDVGWHSSAVAWLLSPLRFQLPDSDVGYRVFAACSPHSQPFLSMFRGFRGTMSSLSLSSTLQSVFSIP